MIAIDPTFFLDFNTHMSTFRRLATINNAGDRQTTVRAIGIGRLRHSIGGLTIVICERTYENKNVIIEIEKYSFIELINHPFAKMNPRISVDPLILC